jgi:GGDEF domain-containing protein
MRYENTVQWAINTQLADVYRVCANSNSVDELIEHLREPLATWLDIDVTTIAFADDPAVILGSIGHVTEDFVGKIRRHAVRCIEGKGKDIRGAEDIIVQHVGAPPCDDIIDPDGILWTGAIEDDGRLLAVLTFYRQASQQISPLELTALRQIRNMISEGITRLHQKHQELGGNPLPIAVDKTTQSDVAIVRVDDAELITKAFGPKRVRSLQEELIERLSQTFPRAFMIARIAHDQVILIAHPGDGHSLQAWTDSVKHACQTIQVSETSPLKISVELGEVQAIGDSGDSSESIEETTQEHGDIQSPSNVEIDVLAG